MEILRLLIKAVFVLATLWVVFAIVQAQVEKLLIRRKKSAKKRRLD